MDSARWTDDWNMTMTTDKDKYADQILRPREGMSNHSRTTTMHGGLSINTYTISNAALSSDV
jgi:hypothetical protein